MHTEFSKPRVGANTYNPITQEAEAGGSWIQNNLGYVVRDCLKKNSKKKKANGQKEFSKLGMKREMV
jgi:hypothetical protein